MERTFNRQISYQPIRKSEFVPFGEYVILEEVIRESIGGVLPYLGSPDMAFWPDLAKVAFPGNGAFTLGLNRLEPRELVITVTECHSATPEAFVPLSDVIIHVGHPSDGKPNLGLFKAFRVPAGTLVILKEGVWHHAAFPVNIGDIGKANHKPTFVLVFLPPRTYANDCILVGLEEKDQIQIEMRQFVVSEEELG